MCNEILKKLQFEIENNEKIYFQNIFFENAKKLMNDYYMVINEKIFELTELEYYLYYKDKHRDCYVHCNNLQKTCGKFYLHNNSFSENRGGIDITFGNSQYYGGILIRGIKYDGSFISGPANVKEEMLKKLNITKNNTKIEEIQKQLLEVEIKFKEKDNKSNNLIYISYRELGDNDRFKNFRYLLYRFIREDYFIREKIPQKEITKAITKKIINSEKIDKYKTIKNIIYEIETSKEDKFVFLKKNIENFLKYKKAL
jgi:hypothetical protein